MVESILVVAETREGKPTPLTLELLGLARALAGRVDALVFCESDASPALIRHGADRVHWCKRGDDYDPDVWLAAVERAARESRPAAVLAPHTATGADLAPRLAFRLETGVATGCVGVEQEDGKLLFTRPCYGGNVRETMSFPEAPAVATVKAGVGAASGDVSRRGEVEVVETPQIEPRTRVIAREVEAAAGQRLEDAKIVVAGGRGLEGAEGFRVLEDFAKTVGGVVGASRVPCDLGWCPHSWQIGLTGKTVTPDLYFAVGISGAGHHMAGCGNSKTIVAINSDPEAAIFREARFGIVGDYRKVIPELAQAIGALNKE